MTEPWTELSSPSPTELPCAHHWIIDPAEGNTSWGECQKCHLQGEFKNSIAIDNSGNWVEAAKAKRKALEDSRPLVADVPDNPRTTESEEEIEED